MRIPTTLKKQPVIEAAFELRYSRETQISEIVPGFLFHSLGCNQHIFNTPTSQIPKNVRDTDENLHYAVISRLEFKGYYIGVSDHGIIISTKTNYEGWTDFRNSILRVITELKKLNLNNNIIRYSLKYVDFFPSDKKISQLQKLNIDISMAGESIADNPLTLRVERNEDEYTNVIQILSHALVISENGQFDKKGMVLDIETVHTLKKNEDIERFTSNTEEILDRIHKCNKLAFFGCLREETIKELEPEYSENK